MVDDRELAEIIARKLFECGKWSGRECVRIQFMVGHPERPGAGFAEQPLADFIAKVLKEHRSY
jgi:hypothetical protein